MAITAASFALMPYPRNQRLAMSSYNATELPQYSFHEELANAITHGIGILFSISGLGVLTAFASIFGTAWHIVSCAIYSGTMILMYTASTLYHSIPSPRAKSLFRTLDHASIFLMIAGTYTPFTLVSLHGPWGWSLFGVIWGLAAAGIICEFFLLKKYRLLAVAIYIAMGWSVIVAIKPLLAAIPTPGIWLLVAGGLFYSLGAIFYIVKKVPFNHAIWHGFVLAGTICHFFAILLYVIPVYQ